MRDIKKNSSKPSDPVPAIELTHVNRINEALGERDPITTPFYPLTKEAIDAINAIEYITEYIKENEEQKMVKNYNFFWYFLLTFDHFQLVKKFCFSRSVKTGSMLDWSLIAFCFIYLLV